MAEEKFPEKIYIKREYDGDDSYLLCGEEPGDISESEDVIEVGEYQLVRKVNLVSKTIIVEI